MSDQAFSHSHVKEGSRGCGFEACPRELTYIAFAVSFITQVAASVVFIGYKQWAVFMPSFALVIIFHIIFFVGIRREMWQLILVTAIYEGVAILALTASVLWMIVMEIDLEKSFLKEDCKDKEDKDKCIRTGAAIMGALSLVAMILNASFVWRVLKSYMLRVRSGYRERSEVPVRPKPGRSDLASPVSSVKLIYVAFAVSFITQVAASVVFAGYKQWAVFIPSFALLIIFHIIFFVGMRREKWGLILVTVIYEGVAILALTASVLWMIAMEIDPEKSFLKEDCNKNHKDEEGQLNKCIRTGATVMGSLSLVAMILNASIVWRVLKSFMLRIRSGNRKRVTGSDKDLENLYAPRPEHLENPYAPRSEVSVRQKPGRSDLASPVTSMVANSQDGSALTYEGPPTYDKPFPHARNDSMMGGAYPANWGLTQDPDYAQFRGRFTDIDAPTQQSPYRLGERQDYSDRFGGPANDRMSEEMPRSRALGSGLRDRPPAGTLYDRVDIDDQLRQNTYNSGFNNENYYSQIRY